MDMNSLGIRIGRKIITAVGVILCIVFIPLLIVNVTIIIRSFVYPDQVPGFFGFKPFIVLSDSMNPLIKSGDIVLVREIAPNRLAQGDIIAYKEGKSVVTHRIVKITEADGSRQFVTKGDNNNTDDVSPIKEDMVEGLYLLDIPKLGNGAMFMQTPVGIIIFVALPLTLFILYDILRRSFVERPKQKRTTELEKEIERMQHLISSLENKENVEIQTEEEKSQSL